jgi:hypothetical protein
VDGKQVLGPRVGEVESAASPLTEWCKMKFDVSRVAYSKGMWRRKVAGSRRNRNKSKDARHAKGLWKSPSDK